MPNELHELSIDEVSAVDHPATRRTFVIIKREDLAPPPAVPPPVLYPVGKNDDEAEAPPLTTMQRLQQNQLWEQWRPLWWAFQDAVCDIMDGDDDDAGYAPLLVQSIEEFATAAKDILSGLGLLVKAAPLYAFQAEWATEIAKIGAVLSAARRAKLQEVIALLQQLVDEAMPASTASPTQKGAIMAEKVDDVTAQLTTVTKRAEAAEARVVTLEAALEVAKASQADPEALWKGVAPAIRERVEKAEAAAAYERELREKQDYIGQAASFQNLPIKPDDDWEVFKAINDLPAHTETVTKARTLDAQIVSVAVTKAQTLRDRLLQILKAADEGMRAGRVFSEHGVSGTGTHGSAEAKALALIKAKQATAPGLSFSEAMTQVWREHDGLYEQYHVEKSGTRR